MCRRSVRSYSSPVFSVFRMILWPVAVLSTEEMSCLRVYRKLMPYSVSNCTHVHCVQDSSDGMQSYIMQVAYVQDRDMFHSCISFMFLQDNDLADVWKLLESMETETQVKEAAVRSCAEDSHRYHRAACAQLVDALSRLQSVQDAILRSEVRLSSRLWMSCLDCGACRM